MRSPSTPRRVPLVRPLAATALVAAWLLVPGDPAGASSLTGCSGVAASYDADGDLLDSATAQGGALVDDQGSPAFTKKNPFLVDNEGAVAYEGQTDAVITNHSWKITMLGVTIVDGGSANESGTQSDTGDLDLGEELPVPITGLVRVEGELVGDGGSCVGDGYVKVQGNPLKSPVTWVGATFAGAGVAGIVFARPKIRPTKGA